MTRKKNAGKRQHAPNGQPQPYEYAPNKWRVDVSLGYDPVTGKPRRPTIRGKSEDEVLTKMRKLQVKADEGIIKNPSTLTVKEWAEIYLKAYTGHLAPRTKPLYEGYINNYIIPRLGRYKLRALNRAMVQQFVNSITENPLNPCKQVLPTTVHNIHGMLNRLLNQAMEIDYISINPAARAKLPRIEKTEARAMNKREISAFVPQVRGHRFEYAFLFTMYTGLREGEVIALRWEAVDMERGIITVKKQMQKIKGGYQVMPPKENKIRTVHLGELAVDALRKQKQKQAEWHLRSGPAWHNDGYVFTNEIGEHMKRQTFYKNFKDIVDIIGSPDLNIHSLRHTYGTTSSQAGVDPNITKASMGHYSAAFTLDRYGHAMDDERKESSDKLDAKFRGKISG